MRSKVLGIAALALVLALPMAHAADNATLDESAMAAFTATDDAPMAKAIVTAFTAQLCEVGTMTLSASVSALPEHSARSHNAVLRTYSMKKVKRQHAAIVAEVGGWPSSNAS